MSGQIIFEACILALFLAMIIMIFVQKEDPTTEAQINDATAALKQEIAIAETLVGARRPHSAECRAKLQEARACLAFSKHSTRMVVTLSFLLAKRNQGISIARQLIESINISTPPA